MSEIKVNKISPRTACGTVTLGDSGDTIAIGAGVTTSGMGRSGTVDWQTTIKTGDFTATSGEGYFINTTSGAVTATLPASPTALDIVAFSDYANTFSSNALTVARNGKLINGGAYDYSTGTDGVAFTLVFIDNTRGWKLVNDGTLDITGQSSFIIATGGNTTATVGDYKVHTFTGPGTFTVCQAGTACGSNTVDYMVIAGGGSGGGGAAGGGGAGGYRESVPSPAAWTASPLANPGGALPVSAQGYPIVVGGGGAASPGEGPGNQGTQGSTSSFSTISSAGGGKGSGGCVPSPTSAGGPGGSGGGGGYNNGTPQTPHPGGTGNTPPVSPPQGNNGGASRGPLYAGGGGGGAACAGQAGQPGASGAGGAGVTSNITNTPTQRAGGGGGSSYPGSATPVPGGAAGAGGGGAGMPGTGPAINGTANLGGGGGGGAPGGPGTSGAGGSGIVVIRYKFQ